MSLRSAPIDSNYVSWAALPSLMHAIALKPADDEVYCSRNDLCHASRSGETR
jgi:hypothetical protein